MFPDSAAFLLAKVGELTAARFAEGLAPLHLRPRHCGILTLLEGSPRAQMDLAARLRVTPSVVVDMVDELEHLGAVRRARDDNDRRRQVVQLTPVGRRLLAAAAKVALDVEDVLRAKLSEPQRAGFLTAVRQLTSQHGILGPGRAIPSQPVEHLP